MPSGDTRDGPSAGLTGAQAVANVIAAQKRPIVYGIPGGYAAYIFDALFSVRDKVDIHLVRQESLATVMAEAQGRLTGRPAFVVAQGAWILGNGSIGVMEAHLGASPMVLLMDATDGGSFSHLGPYQGGGGGYGSYDLAAAMKAITKRVFVATDPTQALQMTQLAIKHAVTGEPGPVAVIFNHRSLRKRLNAKAEPPAYPDRSYLKPPAATARQSAILTAAQEIQRASRPVIVAGNGVRLAGAEPLLIGFARAHRIPVATTPAGKGVFPENDDLAVGVIGGFGHDAANRVVGDADLIVALGTKLGATDTANANPGLIDLTRQRMLQIDIEALNLSWTFPADVTVQGDLADALPRLSDALSDHASDGHMRVSIARIGASYFDRPFQSSPGKLSARDVVGMLSKRLPDNTVVTCDAGENRLFVLRDYQTKAGGTVLQPNGGGGMGYSIPAAMAAAVNFPSRPAVAVCGDGGIAMSLHGLVSAVELGLTLIVVVLDNGVLGWVYNGQGNRVIASELKDFDYATIARAIGCNAECTDSMEGFEAALLTALRHQGVSVIVAKTTKTDRYQDILSSLNTHDVYAIARKEEIA